MNIIRKINTSTRQNKVIIVVAAAIMVIGVFLPYCKFDANIFGVSTEIISISLSDTTIYCVLFFVFAATAMIVAVLRDMIKIGLIGAGAGVLGSIVLGLLFKNPILLAKVSVGFIDHEGYLFGDEYLGDIATDIVEASLEDGIIAASKELSEYLTISLQIGFYLILVGAIAGCLFSFLEMKKDTYQEVYADEMDVESTSIEYQEKQGLLRCVEGEVKGASIIMNEGDMVTIGRDPQLSNFVIREDKNLSRKHCSISFKNGEFFIVDFSSNGVSLGDGKKLERNQEIKLGEMTRINLTRNTIFTVNIKPN